MKKFIIFLVVVWVIFPGQISAHLPGQPPFFKINGEYTPLYHIPLTSLYDFELPQDGAPDNYLVNERINFELDINRLPAPPEVIKQTKFFWDFGDNQKGEGLTNTHTYTKIGSYILKIYADEGSTPTPQLLQSVIINILPSKDYQLPKAVIKANGWKSNDPLVEILKTNFDKKVTLDATESEAKSSKIVEFFWDFGDQKSGTKPVLEHGYDKKFAQVFPVLRVKDANGFIADAFIQINNEDEKIEKEGSKQEDKSGWGKYLLIGGGIIIFTILTRLALVSKK